MGSGGWEGIKDNDRLCSIGRGCGRCGKRSMEREGCWDASPPIFSPNNLLQPGDTGGEFGDCSGKGSLPKFGEMKGLVGGAKSKFSPDGELGREMAPGGR